MIRTFVGFLFSTACCLYSLAAFADGPVLAQKKMKPALLVIDVQNAFLPYMSDQDKKMAPEIINGAIHLFRSQNLPVIRVYHTDPQWGPKPGSKEFEFPENIAVKLEDPKITKNHPSAFKKTELEKVLKGMGVNTLFLCGLSSTGCVLATYRGGEDLDFDVLMIKDGIMGPKAAQTEMIQDICNSVGFDVLRLKLNNLPK